MTPWTTVALTSSSTANSFYSRICSLFLTISSGPVRHFYLHSCSLSPSPSIVFESAVQMPSISLVSVKRRPTRFTLGHTCASTYTEFPLDRFTIILRPSSNTAPSPLFAKDAEDQLQAKREAAEHVAGTANGVRNSISYTTEPNLEAYLHIFRGLSAPWGLRAEKQACDCDIEIALMNFAGQSDAEFTASQIYLLSTFRSSFKIVQMFQQNLGTFSVAIWSGVGNANIM